MRTLSIAFGGLLLAGTFPALAQTAAETPAAPRYYVGLAAYTSYYQHVGHLEMGYSSAIQSSSFRLPVQLTAGYRISPRVAVQVGLAYSTGSAQYGQTIVYSSPTPGTPSPYYSTEGRSTQTQVAASVLGRYTLTANPAHRLQFDALGGFTLERNALSSQGTYTNNAQGTAVSSDFTNKYVQHTLLLTGGIGARYRLSSRFELTYDFTVNKALTNTTYGNNTTNTLTTSQALGLRYRFGH